MNNRYDGDLSKENSDDSHDECATKLEDSVLSVFLLNATDFVVYSFEVVHVMDVETFDACIRESLLNGYMSFNQNF